jgi:TetR/AcrR family transcriptional regulator
MTATSRSVTRPRKAAGRGAKEASRRTAAPGRAGGPRASHPASARELLLEASLEAFAKHGFEGVSLSEVAREAGTAQPLIHHYFGSKRGLWEAATDFAFHGLEAAFEEARTELHGLDAIAMMKVLLRRYVLFTARRPEVHLILAREAAVEGERLEWLIDRHVDPLHRVLEELIAEAQAEGRIKPIPAPQLIQILNGAVAVFLCSGPLLERLYGIDPRSRDEALQHADALTEVLFHGIEAGDIDDLPARRARPRKQAAGRGSKGRAGR